MVKHCCNQLAKAADSVQTANLFFSLALIFLLSSANAAISETPQPGPTFTVNTMADADDGICAVDHCSLREAMNAANAVANGQGPDEIHFSVGSGAQSIALSATLPVITEAVIIDGATQPGYAGTPIIELNGAGAGEANGLVFGANGSTVRAIAITNFGQNGIQVNANASGNRITANAIFDNGALGIDLGSGGVTTNDVGDADIGANDRQNYPVLIGAAPDGGNTIIQGRLNSVAMTTFELQFFANAACDLSGHGEGETFLGSAVVATDESGNASFTESLTAAVPLGHFVTATATDPGGNTSEFSRCLPAGPGNESWVTALPLSSPAAVEHYLNKPGQARWYRVPVFPGSRLTVRLNNLPANYDVVVYKDVAQAFQELNSLQDLVRLDAEFAPDIFSPGAFSRDVFSSDLFSPDIFSPDLFSPDIFSPDSFSPDIFSPDSFSPDVFSAGGFSPDIFSPDTFSPVTFSPDIVSPDIFNPAGAFASAQTRSAVAASGLAGTTDELVVVNTGNHSGNFYVRVRGRNGAYNATTSFHLEVELEAGSCSSVNPDTLPPTSLEGAAGNYQTIIVADFDRLAETNPAEDVAALTQRLASLVARPEVAGVVVDVGTDNRVAAARVLAQANVACPYAQNVHAEAVKAVINRYRDLNPGLRYVVLAGNDDAIPFYRYPDQALLAPEWNYTPPLADGTASQASLRQNYVLGQDAYGTRLNLWPSNSALPLPDLPVGRLVETATDMVTVLDAYLSTSNGVLVPQTSLVTGYDFLADGATAVQAQLEAGTGHGANTLIAGRFLAPAESWTAAELSDKLLNQGRHDLVYLAGHFGASSALAADYETRLLAEAIATSTVDMANTVVFSAGGHAGYNVVNEHGIAGVTREPDWAQAFARKGATLIAGTGYQAGDTEFIEYAERLYLNFSQQLRIGTGPVAVGDAFVAAKRQYLADAGAEIGGLDEKTLHVTIIFGLPMLRLDMPAGRFTPPAEPTIVTATSGYAAPGPGYELDLRFADVSVTPTMSLNTAPLVDVADPGNSVTATYLAGPGGRVVTRPAEPVRPLEVRNVSVGGRALRGVGFRGGNYIDLAGVLPLMGAPTFDIRSLRPLFTSDYFYPVRLWNVNYYDALINPGNGATRLMLTPAQFISGAPGATTGTLRRYSSLSFRLYYSDEMATYPSGNTPALSDPPAITQVLAMTTAGGDVIFSARVAGDPAAGIQEAWVTYSDAGATSGAWQSLDLAQDPLDTTLWQGTLAAAELGGALPEDLRYFVQAVNGVGLVTMATNLGAYYRPNVDPAQPSPPGSGPAATTLALEPSPASAALDTLATFSAVLTSNGVALAGQEVVFSLGSQRRAITDSQGWATITIPLSGTPGAHELHAVFVGTADYAPATAARPFVISQQGTSLALAPANVAVPPGDETGIAATLADASGQAILQKRIFLVVNGSEGWYATAVTTNYRGEADLGAVALPPGTYTVYAYFGAAVTLPDQTVVTLTDASYAGSSATGSLTLVAP